MSTKTGTLVARFVKTMATDGDYASRIDAVAELNGYGERGKGMSYADISAAIIRARIVAAHPDADDAWVDKVTGDKSSAAVYAKGASRGNVSHYGGAYSRLVATGVIRPAFSVGKDAATVRLAATLYRAIARGVEADALDAIVTACAASVTADGLDRAISDAIDSLDTALASLAPTVGANKGAGKSGDKVERLVKSLKSATEWKNLSVKDRKSIHDAATDLAVHYAPRPSDAPAAKANTRRQSSRKSQAVSVLA